MSQDIINVYSEYIASADMVRAMPKEELERRVTEILANGLAHEIVKHIKELPINYEKEITKDVYSEPGERHKIRINLISDEELHRLREIEHEFNRYNFAK